MADLYPFRCQYCDHRSRALQWGVHDVKRRRERREYERLWVEPPDGWPPPPGRRAPGSGHSINGCSLETDAPFGPGAVVGLKLDVAPSGPPVAVERAMVRSTHLGGAGLAFLRFGPAQRERLRAVVLDLMTKRALDSTPAPARLNPYPHHEVLSRGHSDQCSSGGFAAAILGEASEGAVEAPSDLLTSPGR